MSNLIQTARIQKGISARELARRLDVSPSAVSQLERSEREGSIRWDSLERVLAVLGQRPLLSVEETESADDYGAEAVTDSINRALDDGDEAFALRLLTRAAQVARRSSSDEATSRARRASMIKNSKWETLFRVVYGSALPISTSWTDADRLSRPWYVSQFPSLRERAKANTPEDLKRLNIYLDQRSLERA